jgi:hypothetical protein
MTVAGLDVASGIAGLISLGFSVVSTMYTYITAVKGAPGDILSFQEEADALHRILAEFASLTSSASANAAGSQNSAILGLALASKDWSGIEKCMDRLTDIQKRLGECSPIDGKHGKNFLIRLKWPWKKDIKEIVQQLSRLRDTFNAAISVDTLYVQYFLRLRTLICLSFDQSNREPNRSKGRRKYVRTFSLRVLTLRMSDHHG